MLNRVNIYSYRFYFQICWNSYQRKKVNGPLYTKAIHTSQCTVLHDGTAQANIWVVRRSWSPPRKESSCIVLALTTIYHHIYIGLTTVLSIEHVKETGSVLCCVQGSTTCICFSPIYERCH